MEKTFNIDGKDVNFKATAATVRVYRRVTGRDLFRDLMSLQASVNMNEPSAEAIEILTDLAYCMARQADPEVPGNIEDWLDEFEPNAITGVLADIATLWAANEETTAVSKKNTKTRRTGS